jgi:two-component system, NtrC family, sensor kinase
MNFTWLSRSPIPEELKKLDELSLGLDQIKSIDQNEDLADRIFIIPISEVEDQVNTVSSKLNDYFVWLEASADLSAQTYRGLKESSSFLGTLGAFLDRDQTYTILKSTQERKIKNLRQAEIIQKAKSQNLKIENQVKNLNNEVEQKTHQLFEFREQLENQVSFEKDSILILKNLLEASSFETFYKILINAFKPFSVQNLILFHKISEHEQEPSYKILTNNARLKKLIFTKDEVLDLDKSTWANLTSKPVLEFKLFSIGNQSDYIFGFEFSNFNFSSLKIIHEHIEYLQYIFKMILDYLFDQEKIISDSILWSNSFNSLDDPLLIIDEFYKIVKSNIHPDVQNKNCFKVLFDRNSPCEYCPIKLKQSPDLQKSSINLEDKYTLHSFPVEITEDTDQKLWIHHYESTASINELRAQYIKAEKFSYLGQLVDKVIHQIANPLTGMKASVEFMLVDPTLLSESALREDLTEIQSGLFRCFEIINNLKEFSASEVKLLTTDLSSFVSKTLTLMKSVTRDIRFELVDLENKKITCPIGLVQQVLFNLIYNSCQAMNFSGKIQISAKEDGEFTHLMVHDSGPGISREIEEKIFDPFFSTKSKDQGTGIGLFLSRQIIRQFGGDIVVMNTLSPGALLCIKFPLRME